MTLLERPQILVVDDDEDARLLAQNALSREDYEVTLAISTEDALRKLSVLSFDVAVVDLRLPGLNGVHLLREIRRRWPDTLTIVLTAYPTFESAVAALRAGAHNYFTKPCPPNELRRSIQEGLAERRGWSKRMDLMRAMEQQLTEGLRALREDQPALPPELDSPTDEDMAASIIIRAGPLLIDRGRHIALLGDTTLDLTPTEFEMLALLAERAPAVLSAQELARRALNYDATEQEARDLIRWHVFHLRRKVEVDPENPELVTNVRGIGYRLEVT